MYLLQLSLLQLRQIFFSFMLYITAAIYLRNHLNQTIRFVKCYEDPIAPRLFLDGYAISIKDKILANDWINCSTRRNNDINYI